MPETQNNSAIRPKPGWFKFPTPLPPGILYLYWLVQLRGKNADPWNAFCRQFAEDFQLAVLVVLSILGYAFYEWSEILIDILDGFSPFGDVHRRH